MYSQYSLKEVTLRHLERISTLSLFYAYTRLFFSTTQFNKKFEESRNRLLYFLLAIVWNMKILTVGVNFSQFQSIAGESWPENSSRGLKISQEVWKCCIQLNSSFWRLSKQPKRFSSKVNNCQSKMDVFPKVRLTA